MNEQGVCPRCGSRIAVERCGDLELLRCTACSWKFGSSVYQGPLAGAPDALLVRLRWKDARISAKEAMAAKKVIPQFRDVPISALLERFGKSSQYEVGTIPRPVALRLQETAERHGL